MVPAFKTKEIKPTKTVGQRLLAARKKREMSLEEAERLTKVKLKYLIALEGDRHDLLPTEVYSLGFLRCYGEALNLNTTRLLDQYRLERQAVKNAKTQPTQTLAPARRLATTRFVLTPRTLLTLGSVALVVALVVYIAAGVHSFLAPPQLRIDKPEPDSRVTTSTLLVSGQSDPAVTLTINGELVSVEANGQFRHDLAISPGLNTLELVATSRLGKETRAFRKILAEYPMSVSPSPVGTPTVFTSPLPSVAPIPTPKPSTSLAN